MRLQTETYLYKVRMLISMFKLLKAKFMKGGFSPITPVNGIEEGETVDIILKKNIKNLEFVGMWHDRDDIKDGVDYVKKVRLWDRHN